MINSNAAEALYHHGRNGLDIAADDGPAKTGINVKTG